MQTFSSLGFREVFNVAIKVQSLELVLKLLQAQN